MDEAPRSTASEPAEQAAAASEPADRAEQQTDDVWRRVLTGEDRGLPRLRWMWGHVPSAPRCKLCAAPFHGPGALITKAAMHGPSMSNPLLCNACFGQIRKHPGGAEIEISVLFADIRGSTGIAERTSAVEFRRLVQQFYLRAAKAIDQSDGIIDKFLGDGIMALFIPVMSGPMHARRAVEAGEALLRAVVDPQLVAGGVRVGAGVQTGPAFVGTVGSDEKLDFTALGDTVNVAARLGSDAGAGELLVTTTAWRAAGREGNAERRELTVKGRAEPLEVVVLGAATEAAIT
ncbi:MAG TPA: adenylate/guanylate cyclase domain-containing protein [Candidatus Limnocylindrales bacterium]